VTNITYNNSVIVDRGPSYDDLRARSSQPIERFRLERTQDFNHERPVFRGEVVALPALDFRPAERSARPARVGHQGCASGPESPRQDEIQSGSAPELAVQAIR
jgi:hypothetical protein